MKHNIFLVFCLVTLLFSSCVSDNSMSAGKKVAILMAAEDYSIGIEKSMDTEKGKKSFLSLKLINIKGDFASMPFEQSTSFAALNFYSSLNAKDYADVKGIKIIMESDSGDKEAEFSFNDLNQAKKDFKIIENFFATFNDDENKFLLIDTSYMPKEDVLFFSDKAEELGLRDANGISLTGFRFTHLEMNNKDIIVLWVDKRNGNILLKYTFYLLQETHKIIYIKATGRK